MALRHLRCLDQALSIQPTPVNEGHAGARCVDELVLLTTSHNAFNIFDSVSCSVLSENSWPSNTLGNNPPGGQLERKQLTVNTMQISLNRELHTGYPWNQ